jgi:hypothetical protein
MACRALLVKLMYGLSREAIRPSLAVTRGELWQPSAGRRQQKA